MPIYKMEGKKDGQQKYRVRINYKDALGNNKQIDRVVYGSENAKTLERSLIQQVREEAPAARLTVGQLYDEYVKTKQYEVRESSLYKSMQILSNHVIPYFKDDKLNHINLQALQKWKRYIEEKGLSITMKQNIFGEFRAMVNYAVKFGYMSSNPLTKIGNFKDAYELKKHMDYYTAEEFLKYIEVAKSEAQKQPNNLYEWNFYVFFNIAFYTGMRKGEIHALKWTDIDDDIIHITRSIAQKLKGGDRETPPKNKSSVRDLQMPEPLKNILAEHYKRYSVLDNFSDEWRICGGISPLRDGSVDNHNRKFAQLAGLKHIRIHDFRHSHASLLANEGINIQEIARRLGHAKIEMTWNTYSHLYPREEERAVKILDKIV